MAFSCACELAENCSLRYLELIRFSPDGNRVDDEGNDDSLMRYLAPPLYRGTKYLPYPHFAILAPCSHILTIHTKSGNEYSLG